MNNESAINEKQASGGNNICHWVSTRFFFFSVILADGSKQ